MGSSIASPGKGRESPAYQPRIIEPNLAVQRARQNFQVALADKRAYWQGEIEQAVEEFGASALAESVLALAKELGIDINEQG